MFACGASTGVLAVLVLSDERVEEMSEFMELRLLAAADPGAECA